MSDEFSRGGFEPGIVTKEYVDAAVAGGGGGAALPDLFFDVIKIGTGLGWTALTGGDYVWGGGYQALDDLTIVGAKGRSANSSGTLVLSVWVDGVKVRTKSTPVTGLGLYSVTFDSPLPVTAGQVFRVSGRVTGSGGNCNIPSADYDLTYVPVAGPKLRLLASNLYGYTDQEPVNPSSSRLFGVIPVLG